MSPMNPRLLVPRQEPGILDFAPGAAAAYSLRKLSLSYNSPVVTVRRSTDSAEADFTASEVSDGTLAAWCGGGDGFVKQWWDQTGSNHATQSTAGYQPQIVDSGTLVTEGGKPALQFDGSNDQFNAFTSSLSPSTVSSVAKCTSSGTYPNGRVIIGGTSPANAPVVWIEAGRFEFIPWSQNMTGPLVADGTQNVLTATNTGTTRECWVNGGERVSATGAQTDVAALRIGTASGLQPFLGTISELIVHAEILATALRTRIEGNMNRNFGVF